MALLLVLLAVATLPVAAQSDSEGASAVADDDPTAAGAPLSDDEARRLLAEPPAADPAAHCAQPQQQWHAAQRLEQRTAMVELSRQLVETGSGRLGGEAWIRQYLNAGFTWGSSGKALSASIEIGRLLLPKTFEEVHVWQWQAPQGRQALRLK